MSAVSLSLKKQKGLAFTKAGPGLTAGDLEIFSILCTTIGSYLLAIAALWSYQPIPRRSITIYVVDGPPPVLADIASAA